MQSPLPPEFSAQEFLWPDEHRRVFGPAMDPAIDARLDWIHADGPTASSYYQNAYQAAVELIHRAAVEGSMTLEYAVLPLAFLWRHLIELKLKELIRVGRELRLDTSDPPQGHGLLGLRNTAEEFIRPLGKPDDPVVANARAILTEFAEMDPGADGFRYPIHLPTRKDPVARRTLANAPDRVSISILHDAMKACCNFLSGVVEELSNRLDFFREWESEAGGKLSVDQRRESREAYTRQHDPKWAWRREG